MKFTFKLFFGLFCFTNLLTAQTQLLDIETKYPVAFATVSFGNGNGLFADDEGVFVFTKKLYSDIDTLYISALGYKDLKLPTQDLPKTILLESFADELEEVSLTALPKGKFKIEEEEPIFHDDYHKCWLPTIESEIAVFFSNESQQTKRITEVYIPIKTEAKDWRTRNRKNTPKKEFSTLFRVQFYKNNEGFPGEPLTFSKMVFVATEENEDFYTLDIKDQNIFIPKDGIFVSIQVLGFTDDKGKLLPNKKYQEVKTRRGIVKVSTTFRPLLPFTNEMSGKRTFVKRIFLNDGDWILFDKQNISNSNLLATGMNNYGIGLKAEVYYEN
jgi:hypothetical protein